MSKYKPRISREDVEFDPYACACIDFLNSISSGIIKHYERLGLSSGKMAIVTALRNQWRTNDPDNPGVYEKKTGLTTKGTLATQLSNKCKRDFIKAFQPMLNTIAASENITLEDYNLFNIAIPKGSVHHKTDPITDITHFLTRIIGNGEIEISLKTNDSKLASIGPLADSYEVAGCIVDPSYTGVPPLQGLIRKTPPETPNDCPYRFITKKARFIQNFDLEYSGLKAYGFARNYHTSYPQLAGPWSEMCIEIIP